MEHPKIETRCPSCGNATLFIGAGGWLTCSWIACANPSVGNAIDQLKEAARVLDAIRPLIDNTLAMLRDRDADGTPERPWSADAGTLPGRNRAGQIIDRLHSNDAGQRYMAPPPSRWAVTDGAAVGAVIGSADFANGTTHDGRPRCATVMNGARCQVEHGHELHDKPHAFEVPAHVTSLATDHDRMLVTRYERMVVSGLQPTTADGHPRCDAQLHGRQCTRIAFHDASMNPTPHEFDAAEPGQ